MNAILLAVALGVISLAINTIRDHGQRIGSLERDVAVIQGNRFTSGDAFALVRELTYERSEALRSLRDEIMQRFDRIETRIDHIGGTDENGRLP